MDMQTLIALLLVLAAVLYMGRRAWRTVRAGGARGDDDGGSCGSGTGCGCG